MLRGIVVVVLVVVSGAFPLRLHEKADDSQKRKNNSRLHRAEAVDDHAMHDGDDHDDDERNDGQMVMKKKMMMMTNDDEGDHGNSNKCDAVEIRSLDSDTSSSSSPSPPSLSSSPHGTIIMVPRVPTHQVDTVIRSTTTIVPGQCLRLAMVLRALPCKLTRVTCTTRQPSGSS